MTSGRTVISAVRAWGLRVAHQWLQNTLARKANIHAFADRVSTAHIEMDGAMRSPVVLFGRAQSLSACDAFAEVDN
jgi:hypothetical protein